MECRAVVPFKLAGLLLVLLISSPLTASAKPTEADVDLAIKACTVTTRIDANLQGGLITLKRRILSGEGKVEYAEIPSVIGTPVIADESKIKVFERIQDCVIKNAYG